MNTKYNVERLNELKHRCDWISAKQASTVAEVIAQARRPQARLKASADGRPAAANAEQLRGASSRYNDSKVCDKRKRFWQRHMFSFRLPVIIKITADHLRSS